MKHIRLLAWAWTLLLVFLLLLPGTDLPEAPWSWTDKLVHVVSFYLFGSLWLQTYPHRRLHVLLAGIILALGSETLQALLPIHRSAEVWDVVADMAGLVLSLHVPVFSLFLPKSGKKSSRQ